MTEQELERLEHLKKHIPSLSSPERGSTCLYVGASKIRCEIYSLLRYKYWEMILVEAYKPNVDYYEKRGIFDKIYHDTIEHALSYLPIFNTVVWWHGPEHVGKESLPGLLQELEKHSSRLIVLACPWGIYEQGAYEGNPYEKHLSYLYESDFLGYNVATLGQIDTKGSNLLAWKNK